MTVAGDALTPKSKDQRSRWRGY